MFSYISLYSVSFDLEGVCPGALDTQTTRPKAWRASPKTQHFLIKLWKAFLATGATKQNMRIEPHEPNRTQPAPNLNSKLNSNQRPPGTALAALVPKGCLLPFPSSPGAFPQYFATVSDMCQTSCQPRPLAPWLPRWRQSNVLKVLKKVLLSVTRVSLRLSWAVLGLF